MLLREVERHPLGNTGLRVSRIALGTVALGLEYGPPGSQIVRPDFDNAARLLNYALDNGVNLIDTARSYGESEDIIGRAIGHRRNEFVLASKVIPSTERAAIQSVEQSLRALRADVLDIVQIHCRADNREPDAATTEALLKLRQQGKIRFLGASVYGPETASAAIRSGHFQILQIAYSMLDRRPEQHTLAAAHEQGIGVLARSVLLKGVLTKRYRTLPPSLAQLREAVERLINVTGQSEDSLPEIAYRFVLSRPQICALSGASSLPELTETLSWASLGALPDELLSKIRSIRPPSEEILNPGNWN